MENQTRLVIQQKSLKLQNSFSKKHM